MLKMLQFNSNVELSYHF